FPSQLPIRHATAPSIRLLFCCRKAASLRLPSHLQAGRSRNFRLPVLVVDDVWREQDISPFMQGGSSTTRLITTRNDSTLPTNAIRQNLDAMRDSEAFELIAMGLPAPSTQRRELMALAARLGEWLLLLKLVNPEPTPCSMTSPGCRNATIGPD